MRLGLCITAGFSSVLLMSSTVAGVASAAWPRHPHTNLPICTASGAQGDPEVVSDGAGGAIVAWHDYRGGSTGDIYAQHILATGEVDPAWPANGRALCTQAADQNHPILVSDGAGGAIVSWHDFRGGATSDLYATRILASGQVDPGWPVNGRALCTAPLDQFEQTMVSDGAGGAIVTWVDQRSGAADVYAQRLLASGAVDPAWPVNGRALCTAAGDQSEPVLVSDGAGGAIVAWYDGRSGTTDIYAQRVRSTGIVDPDWPANGRALCTAAGNQFIPVIVSDGAGGAIVAWQDGRSDPGGDLYAQHVLSSGGVDPGWPVDGRAVCTALGDQSEPVIVSDGAGGAVLGWYDSRGGSPDIYAHRLLSSGIVDPAWPVDGRALCTAAGSQIDPAMVDDGGGGAVVVWQDLRSATSNDLYAQRVLSTGEVDPAWPLDGRALGTAALDQHDPVAIGDGSAGAIVVWHDSRSGSGAEDVYAQRVERFGRLGSPEPQITGVRDVRNDQGGRVKVEWLPSYLDTDPSPVVEEYWVFRSVPSSIVSDATAASRPWSRLEERAARPEVGSRVALPSIAATEYWEFLAAVQAVHFLSGYSYVAATTADSTPSSNPLTLFLVVAVNGNGSQYWPSRPAGGYSVDNLAPSTPGGFAGKFTGSAAHLYWQPNSEPDLAGYRLYRGSTPSFVPGPGNLVSAQADTGYVDPGAQPHYYKLSAIDVHGNESSFALTELSGTAGVGGGGSWGALALWVEGSGRASPRIHFVVPRIGESALELSDAQGRRVRTLWRGALPPGEHARTWDRTDDQGRRAPSGVYFVRLSDGVEMRAARIVCVE